MSSNPDPKAEIAHVATIDVVGYSKLLLDAQTRTMAELNEVVRGSTRFQVASTAGKLIRLPTGDGMALVFFDDPAAAMECALEVATGLKSHPDVRVRMGLHSGPVRRVSDVNEQQNVAGAGIDVAQRVMDCGDAGHILLSKRIAYDLAPMTRWNAHLYELGEAEVKHGEKISLVNFYTEGIGNSDVPLKLKRARAEAVRRIRLRSLGRRLLAAAAVIAICGAAVGFYLYAQRRTRVEPSPAPVPPDKSIAVMPFVDLSPAKDQEYFCDGVSEEILDTLARVEGLRVVAQTSSFSFKGKDADASEIGRRLNVATILEGSLRRDGDRIRVTAQLVNARDGFHIWSATIEKEMQSVFALQDQITGAIVEALKIKLSGVPRVRSAKNGEAYDLYLHGLDLSNRSDEASLRRSLDYFERAIDKDPSLARAWTGVAKDWVWLADAYVAPREAYPKAGAAARKALELDEHEADAHAYLGETKRVMNYDLKGEETELNRALEIDANSAVAHLFMCLLQGAFGQSRRALEEIHKAVQLDPLSPIIGNWEVNALVVNNRLDEAFTAAKRTMEIDPDYIYFEPDLALVYRQQGKLQQALEIYERVAQAQHRPTAGLAITYARLGKKEQAQKALDDLIVLANTSYFPADEIAAVYVAVGNKEEALHWLNRAVDEHSAPIHRVAFDPDFRALHAERLFGDVLERVGIDPKTALKKSGGGGAGQ
jgi:adenylate cyclase